MGLRKDQNSRSLLVISGASAALKVVLSVGDWADGLLKCALSIHPRSAPICASVSGSPMPVGGMLRLATFRIKMLLSDAPSTTTGPLALPFKTDAKVLRSKPPMGLSLP